MPRSSLLALLVVASLLTACVSSSGVPDGTSSSARGASAISRHPANVTLTLQEEEYPVELGDPVYGYTLVFSGALGQNIEIAHQKGLRMQYVDPSLYANPNTIAMFSGYYAGLGTDVKVDQEDETIMVYRRINEEGTAEEPGGCGNWQAIGSYTAGSGAYVEFLPSGPGVTQVAFICEE